MVIRAALRAVGGCSLVERAVAAAVAAAGCSRGGGNAGISVPTTAAATTAVGSGLRRSCVRYPPIPVPHFSATVRISVVSEAGRVPRWVSLVVAGCVVVVCTVGAVTSPPEWRTPAGGSLFLVPLLGSSRVLGQLPGFLFAVKKAPRPVFMGEQRGGCYGTQEDVGDLVGMAVLSIPMF